MDPKTCTASNCVYWYRTPSTRCSMPLTLPLSRKNTCPTGTFSWMNTVPFSTFFNDRCSRKLSGADLSILRR